MGKRLIKHKKERRSDERRTRKTTEKRRRVVLREFITRLSAGTLSLFM